ncbi:hypothetical protein EYC51_07040 [Alcaligenes faecalis]|nr:hypothetical protein EYC51_07040 [Alcaligenes faecalis]
MIEKSQRKPGAHTRYRRRLLECFLIGRSTWRLQRNVGCICHFGSESL